MFVHSDGRVALIAWINGRSYGVAVFASEEAMRNAAAPVLEASLIGEPNSADILAALPAGFVDASDPPLPILPSPPPSVTAWQIRRWLVANGISLASVDAAINAIPDAALREKTRVDWEYAPYIERSHPMLPPLAGALGITDLDAAFIAAEKIA